MGMLHVFGEQICLQRSFWKVGLHAVMSAVMGKHKAVREMPVTWNYLFLFWTKLTLCSNSVLTKCSSVLLNGLKKCVLLVSSKLVCSLAISFLYVKAVLVGLFYSKQCENSSSVSLFLSISLSLHVSTSLFLNSIWF